MLRANGLRSRPIRTLRNRCDSAASTAVFPATGGVSRNRGGKRFQDLPTESLPCAGLTPLPWRWLRPMEDRALRKKYGAGRSRSFLKLLIESLTCPNFFGSNSGSHGRRAGLLLPQVHVAEFKFRLSS